MVLRRHHARDARARAAVKVCVCPAPVTERRPSGAPHPWCIRGALCMCGWRRTPLRVHPRAAAFRDGAGRCRMVWGKPGRTLMYRNPRPCGRAVCHKRPPRRRHASPLSAGGVKLRLMCPRAHVSSPLLREYRYKRSQGFPPGRGAARLRARVEGYSRAQPTRPMRPFGSSSRPGLRARTPSRRPRARALRASARALAPRPRLLLLPGRRPRVLRPRPLGCLAGTRVGRAPHRGGGAAPATRRSRCGIRAKTTRRRACLGRSNGQACTYTLENTFQAHESVGGVRAYAY